MNKLLERLKINEGFRSKVYKCTMGIDTFGYGFTYITREEADLILEMRLKDLWEQAEKVLDDKKIHLNDVRKGVIVEMFYQLGKEGTLKFVKMWDALSKKDYNKAALEMLDSNWYIQTPARCKQLSLLMRKGV